MRKRLATQTQRVKDQINRIKREEARERARSSQRTESVWGAGKEKRKKSKEEQFQESILKLQAKNEEARYDITTYIFLPVNSTQIFNSEAHIPIKPMPLFLRLSSEKQFKVLCQFCEEKKLQITLFTKKTRNEPWRRKKRKQIKEVIESQSHKLLIIAPCTLLPTLLLHRLFGITKMKSDKINVINTQGPLPYCEFRTTSFSCKKRGISVNALKKKICKKTKVKIKEGDIYLYQVTDSSSVKQLGDRDVVQAGATLALMLNQDKQQYASYSSPPFQHITLNNITGVDCFLNSLLQLLHIMPLIRNHLLLIDEIRTFKPVVGKKKEDNGLLAPKQGVICALSELFSNGERQDDATSAQHFLIECAAYTKQNIDDGTFSQSFFLDYYKEPDQQEIHETWNILISILNHQYNKPLINPFSSQNVEDSAYHFLVGTISKTWGDDDFQKIKKKFYRYTWEEPWGSMSMLFRLKEKKVCVDSDEKPWSYKPEISDTTFVMPFTRNDNVRCFDCRKMISFGEKILLFDQDTKMRGSDDYFLNELLEKKLKAYIGCFYLDWKDKLLTKRFKIFYSSKGKLRFPEDEDVAFFLIDKKNEEGEGEGELVLSPIFDESNKIISLAISHEQISAPDHRLTLDQINDSWTDDQIEKLMVYMTDQGKRISTHSDLRQLESQDIESLLKPVVLQAQCYKDGLYDEETGIRYNLQKDHILSEQFIAPFYLFLVIKRSKQRDLYGAPERDETLVGLPPKIEINGMTYWLTGQANHMGSLAFGHYDVYLNPYPTDPTQRVRISDSLLQSNIEMVPEAGAPSRKSRFILYCREDMLFPDLQEMVV